MKRYILFAGYHYYPNGGMWDFKGFADTIEEAKSLIRENDWGHVFDTQESVIVAEYECDHGWEQCSKALEMYW